MLTLCELLDLVVRLSGCSTVMDVTMAYLGLTVIATRRTQGALSELVDLVVRLSGCSTVMDVTMAYLGLTVIAPRRTQGALCGGPSVWRLDAP